MARHLCNGCSSRIAHGDINNIIIKILLILLQTLAIAGARELELPLSTRSRWIVDRFGVRVKLACVNWVGHLEAGIPEGLSKNTAHGIATLIKLNGFNCVRLTSSTWLWTNDSYGDLTVAQNFNRLNLTSASLAFATLNPEFHLLSLREVHIRVVDIVSLHGLMVVLDNHVSKPQWCCSDTDGNGFWGDEYFDVETWLSGLTIVARTFIDNSYVVAMSLRNELRGPRQNVADWRAIIEQAAIAVHRINANVLIIAGGLSYATDLTFMNNYPLDTSLFRNKLVYEFHWYKWSGLSQNGDFNNPNDSTVCSSSQNKVHSNNGFLVDQGQPSRAPLLLSEFGINLDANNYGENRFLDCVIDYLAKGDVDWAYWTLQGSYYLRNSIRDLDESYGLLNSSWRYFRNPSVVARLQHSIQNSTQGTRAL